MEAGGFAEGGGIVRAVRAMPEATFRYQICLARSHRSDQELADLLHVSLPTISRWTEGRNLPYSRIRWDAMRAILGVA